MRPCKKWRFNFVFGVDDVDSGDVNMGDRILNRCVFGNAVYPITKNAEIGVELSHWRIEYNGPGDADDMRAQLSLIYNFK